MQATRTASHLPGEALAALGDHSLHTRIAVIGASEDPSKYGAIILRDLTARGYDVRAVNPHLASLEGRVCVPTVAAIAEPVAIANFVVPPRVALQIVRQLDPTQVGTVWFQPGSYDAEVLAAARERFTRVVAGDCIMVVARWA